MNRRYSKIVLWTLTIIWVVVIFGFSTQDAVDSSALSSGITTKIFQFMIEQSTPDLSEQQQLLSILHHFTREVAHVAIYLALGILLACSIKQSVIKRPFTLTFVMCFVCAIVDELVQEFCTIGRSFQLYDLLKDWSGSLIGIWVVYLSYRIWDKRTRKDQ